MELNGLANIQCLLELSTDETIDNELRDQIQQNISLMVTYFRKWNKDNTIKWHEVIAEGVDSNG